MISVMRRTRLIWKEDDHGLRTVCKFKRQEGCCLCPAAPLKSSLTGVAPLTRTRDGPPQGGEPAAIWSEIQERKGKEEEP